MKHPYILPYRIKNTTKILPVTQEEFLFEKSAAYLKRNKYRNFQSHGFQSKKISQAMPLIEQVVQHIYFLSGLKSKRFPYFPDDILVGQGNVQPHTDFVFEYAAATLIATRKPHRYAENPVFISAGKFLSISLGCSFIFHTATEHAWMAECQWILAISQLSSCRVNANVAQTTSSNEWLSQHGIFVESLYDKRAKSFT
jgi:hypothetical protein